MERRCGRKILRQTNTTGDAVFEHPVARPQPLFLLIGGALSPVAMTRCRDPAFG